MSYRCQKCNEVKSDKEFYPREDRTGPYAWCITCMEDNNRELNWPEQKDWGWGKIYG